MKLRDLTPNQRNPRKITDERLAGMKKSYETWGPLHGILFNRTTKRLMGGHQTQKCLPPDCKITITKEFEKPTSKGTIAQGFVTWGDEIITYREFQVDEVTENAINIAANAWAGEWDFTLLPDILLEIDTANIDLDLLGLTNLADILAPTQEIEKQDKESEKKFSLEVTLPDEQTLIEVYNDLLKRGFIVKHR